MEERAVVNKNVGELANCKPDFESSEINFELEFQTTSFDDITSIMEWKKVIEIPKLRVERKLSKDGLGVLVDPLFIRILNVLENDEIGLTNLKFNPKGLCFLFAILFARIQQTDYFNQFFKN